MTLFGLLTELIVRGDHADIDVNAVRLYFRFGRYLDHWIDEATGGYHGSLSDTRFDAKFVHIADFG